MRNIISILLLLIFIATYTSACQRHDETVVIKSKNTFKKYIKQEPKDNIIDLSEGPKLNYDKYIGPKPLNFDFKIINPY